MCGLAGLFNFSNSVQTEHLHELALILEEIKARGPDAQKISRCGTHAALGGARLRITDSSNVNADLPMTSFCGRYTAVLNGEIYNHLKLRHHLPAENFRTRSDTETLIEAFRKWGPDCVHRFEGMYAIAVYDQQERRLYIARDPSGQKPLYYIQDKSSFVFASDIKALIADPYREKTFCTASLSEFVSQRMILGEDTHIKEIKKLPGGCYIIVEATGQLQLNSYYTLPISESALTDPRTIATSIHKSIARAVTETANIEHPASLLLSGGIDSTGLLALLQKHGVNPKTYAIGFEKFSGDNFGIASSFDEFEYSRFAARYYGTDHTELIIRPEDYLDSIISWSRMMGEPLEASEAPLLLQIFKRISDDGLRLAYGGSGPDEIFDGYGLGLALDRLAIEDVPAAYFNKFSWVFDVDVARLMPQSFSDMRERAVGKMELISAPYLQKTNSPLQIAQTINFHGRLQAYEFYEMDLTSASQSIEVRSPLIAKPVIESAFSFDPNLKRQNGIPKWIYKESWRDVIPDEIIDRPKSGFETPIEFWFSDIYEKAVEETLFDTASPVFSMGFIDIDYLRLCWEKRDPAYRSIFYRLLCLALMLSEQKSLLSKSSPHPAEHKEAA